MPIAQSRENEPVTRFIRKDFAALRGSQTVGDALVSLRRTDLAQKIIYLYVLNDDGKLIGVVPTRRLLMSEPHVRLSDIMVHSVVCIPETATALDACEFFVVHRLLALPVVDARRHIIGVVDVNLLTDEVFDLTVTRSAEDAFQLIGIHVAQGRSNSAWDGFKNRFPWLLCNIGGGITCALLASFYEPFLNSVIVLALFIPVVLALAESVSIQSMTMTLQSLHTGKVGWRSLLRAMKVEFFTALLLGLAAGATVAGVVLLWKRQPSVAIAIGGSIASAIVTACILGVFLPRLVHGLRMDPKVAAGPIVLAFADVATLLFYFNLSGLLLS